MLKAPRAAVVFAFVCFVAAASALATDTVVNTSASLRNAFNAAQPGDRILMAPGTYTDTMYVDGTTGGTPDKPIIICAQDPLNPPVFNLGPGKMFMTDHVSNFVIDGLVLKTADAINGIQIAWGQNVVLKNFKQIDTGTAVGNSAIKFSVCTNFLMYNMEAVRWGDSGVDMVACAKGLMMNNHMTNSNINSNNGFQAKGGSFNIGEYNNVLKDCGNRVLNMGQSTGAPYFYQGNYGWECYDSVAMGNKLIGCTYPLSYSNANNIRFDYNTVVGPKNALLRILSESTAATNPSSNGSYSHNLVQYGSLYEYVNMGSNTNPGSFTFDGNYWYRTTNPAGSIPPLVGTQINNVGGTNPQLDANYDPQYDPAKAYGADAPGKNAAWLTQVNKFQWSWDVAQSYLPQAQPGATADGSGVTFDASASGLGASSYGSNTLFSYGWDMNNDGVADVLGTSPMISMSYADLASRFGITQGTYNIGLIVSVTNELGVVVPSDEITTVITVPEPMTLALLGMSGLAMLRRRK